MLGEFVISAIGLREDRTGKLDIASSRLDIASILCAYRRSYGSSEMYIDSDM